MYLMYYLNEDGKRVYTLKVRKLYISHRSLCEYKSLVCSRSVLSRLFFSLRFKKAAKKLIFFYLISKAAISRVVWS